MYLNGRILNSCVKNVFISQSRRLSLSFNRSIICNTSLLRKFSSLPDKTESHSPTIFDRFGTVKHIYKFPYISYCNWMVNLKWYCLPLCFMTAVYLQETASEGSLDPDEFNIYFITMMVILVKCNLVALPFRNFVAHIYITPEEDVVVSFLNLKGLRVDEKFPKGDLYLKSRESSPLRFIIKDAYYLLMISRSTKKIFRINFKHCEMFDEELFQSAIGIIPESAIAY